MRGASVRVYLRSVAIVSLAILIGGCGSTVPSEPASHPAASAVSSMPPAPTEPRTPTVEPQATEIIGPVAREQFGAAAIAFFDTAHGLVVGAGGPSATSGVIRRTSDGGRTWGSTTTLDSGPLVAVAVAPPHRAWAVAACRPEAPTGCIDGLFRSDDSGATWTRISATVALSPSFVDRDLGWAIKETNEPAGGTEHALLATSDGGRTWKAVSTGCPARFGGTVAVSFVDRLHGWVGCNETYGAGAAAKGIAETVDGGLHWSVRSGTSGDQGSVGSISWSDYLFALEMRPGGDGMWLGSRGYTARTSDGGRRWTYGPPGDFDVDIANAMALPTDRTWFLVMWLANEQVTALERSDDAGLHWTVVGLIGAP